MKKVEYVVGVFLTETDIITHEIPEIFINDAPKSEKKINSPKNGKPTIKRKTEHSTKKRNKPQNGVENQ